MTKGISKLALQNISSGGAEFLPLQSRYVCDGKVLLIKSYSFQKTFFAPLDGLKTPDENLLVLCMYMHVFLKFLVFFIDLHVYIFANNKFFIIVRINVKVMQANHPFFLNLKLNFVCFCRHKRIYFNAIFKARIQYNGFHYSVFIYTCHYILLWVLIFTYILELDGHIIFLKIIWVSD